MAEGVSYAQEGKKSGFARTCIDIAYDVCRVEHALEKRKE